MEPVPEVPYTDNRKSDDRRISVSQQQQQSPRHSLLFDDQGRPITKVTGKSTSGAESPIIPDANSLKRKLHNLFLSGPSLRSRPSEGSLGSAASASPVSTGSPMEWPSGDVTPTSMNTSNVFPMDSFRSRDISLEEELQSRLAQMSEAARTWQTRWRQEREDTCRLTDHLARCETESKRLIESVSAAYTKKVKMIEETLIRSMKTNEQLLIEKNMLEDRLKQSKEIIDLQRHEIEQEFSRARKDVELLRTEVGHMQSRTQRLEKENDALKTEKQILSNELNMFTGNTKQFNVTLKETDVRCELYRVLLDMAMRKLKVLENGGDELYKERANVSRLNSGRFVLRVDAKDPTSMHVEDVYETQEAMESENSKSKTDAENAQENKEEDKENNTEQRGKVSQRDTELVISKPKTHVIRQLEIHEIPRTRSVPVVHMTSEAYSQSISDKLNRSQSPSSSPQRVGYVARSDKTNRSRSNGSFSMDPIGTSTPNDDKSKCSSNKKSRRFSFGKDKMKQLGGSNKADVTTSSAVGSKVEVKPPGATMTRVLGKSKGSRCQELPGHSHSLDNPGGGDFFTEGDSDLDISPVFHQRRPRSLSDSEDMNILLDTTTREYTDERGNTCVDIQQTTYRHRSNTMDGAVEKPRKSLVESHRLTSESPTSSNEELRNTRTSGFEVLRARRNGFSSSSPESGGGKSFMMRKYKTKDISDLFRVFTSDKDGKDQSKSKQKKGLFGK